MSMERKRKREEERKEENNNTQSNWSMNHQPSRYTPSQAPDQSDPCHCRAMRLLQKTVILGLVWMTQGHRRAHTGMGTAARRCKRRSRIPRTTAKSRVRARRGGGAWRKGGLRRIERRGLGCLHGCRSLYPRVLYNPMNPGASRHL